MMKFAFLYFFIYFSLFYFLNKLGEDFGVRISFFKESKKVWGASIHKWVVI